MVRAARANTILYCEPWNETIEFYRDALGLAITFENDWFVEFEVAPGCFVSIADSRRSSIAPGDGRGITLSWEVADVAAERRRLLAHGVAAGELRPRFGSLTVDLFDPTGNRIELWSRPA